jgi:hypothetical protein
MAEPKLDIEKRLDRVELTLGVMASWLVKANVGFTEEDALGMQHFLRGTSSQEPKLSKQD